MDSLPDALVCGGGGTLGEAWMRGLLNGLEHASGLDFRGCESFVGTSAGSIVTALLAAGRRPDAGDEAARAWAADAPAGMTGGAGTAGGGPVRGARSTPAGEAGAAPPGLRSAAAGLARGAGRLGATAIAPVLPLGLAATRPAGAAMRAAALAAVPRGERSLDRLSRLLERLDGRFDGRLRIAAVDRRTGRRVMFGAPGAPDATVRAAVLASCAIPGVFAPVTIGGREYVDGGVWSPTNLDAAPVGRGGRVLCLVPTAGGGPFRAPTAAASGAEVLALRARGVEVRLVAPDERSVQALGANLMDATRVPAVLAAGYAQGRRL